MPSFAPEISDAPNARLRQSHDGCFFFPNRRHTIPNALPHSRSGRGRSAVAISQSRELLFGPREPPPLPSPAVPRHTPTLVREAKARAHRQQNYQAYRSPRHDPRRLRSWVPAAPRLVRVKGGSSGAGRDRALRQASRGALCGNSSLASSSRWRSALESCLFTPPPSQHPWIELQGD